mmetsp:Transcript_13209/g.43055  ORF Transcript_13209/g.43055 Transcript_13209/m.43055 type:complete len:224 (-) Transcript_13209:852-1523(-)
MPDWRSLAPSRRYAGERRRSRDLHSYRAFWTKNDGLVAPATTINFTLEVRDADFKERKARHDDAEAPREAATDAAWAEKRRVARRKPAEWTALSLAERRKQALASRIRKVCDDLGRHLTKLGRDCDLDPPSPTAESIIGTFHALNSQAGGHCDVSSRIADHFALVVNPKVKKCLADLVDSLCWSVRTLRSRERRQQSRRLAVCAAGGLLVLAWGAVSLWGPSR